MHYVNVIVTKHPQHLCPGEHGMIARVILPEGITPTELATRVATLAVRECTEAQGQYVPARPSTLYEQAVAKAALAIEKGRK